MGYLLFRAPGPVPSWPEKEPDPIGTLPELMAALAGLFPGVEWRPVREPGARFGVWNDGDGHAEFVLASAADGKVRWFSMSKTPRANAERVCHHLGVVAGDELTMELYSTSTRTWARGG